MFKMHLTIFVIYAIQDRDTTLCFFSLLFFPRLVIAVVCPYFIGLMGWVSVVHEFVSLSMFLGLVSAGEMLRKPKSRSHGGDGYMEEEVTVNSSWH